MKTRNLLLSLLTCLSLFGTIIRADDQMEPDSSNLNIGAEDVALHRGYLPVPSSVSATANQLSTEIVSPAFLGSTTTNFCKCALYRLSKNLEYTVSGNSSIPMIRITATGVDFDLSHNCACFSRRTLANNASCFSSTTTTAANACDVHGVGIEVGWGPNLIGTNTQPDSVVIENGIMCDWDIAILIHAGVRNVTIRNMVFTDNVIPIMALGRNGSNGCLEKEVTNITLENVAILGSDRAMLTCLKWVRMYLTDGVAISPMVANLTNSLGYNYNEVMPLEADPVADQFPDYTDFTKGLYVYAGMYFYGTSNIQLKNVSVNGIGYDGNVAAVGAPLAAERTAAYGMWFRNCRSIFTEDIEACKTKSGLVAAGMYFDDCKVVSIKKAQVTDNGLQRLEFANAAPVITIEGMWAAGVVLKDTNTVHFDDVVMSHTRGLDTAWGLRTIYSYYIPLIHAPLYQSVMVNRGENYEFENVWADFLHGDRVYAYDFGDIFRKKVDGSVITNLNPSNMNFNQVNGRLPAGSVRALRMKNVSSCGCAGILDCVNNQPEIAKEYKGIYLGDDSGGIQIDGARIETNNVVSGVTATGRNSGIEFGSPSWYLINPAGISKAVGTIYDAKFNALSISRNTGGYLNNSFVGIRAVSTGATGINAAGTNVFSDVSISNSQIDSNQFDGIRVVDDIDGLAPVTAKAWVLDNVSISGSIDGYGATFQTLINSVMSKVKCTLNKSIGFAIKTLIDSVSVSDSQFSENIATSTDAIGFDAQTAGNCLSFVRTHFDFNKAVDGNVAGLHVKSGQSVSLDTCTANCNDSSKNALTGPFVTRGMYFESSVDNVSFVKTEAHNNQAANGNCFGYQVDRATAIFADDMAANNNRAEGTNSTNGNVSKVIGIFFKATVGSEQSEGCLLKSLQACGNHNAYLAYGIHMQSPTGLSIERVDASSNISDATGQINAKPVLSQAVGLLLEGGSSVHITDLNTNSNRQTELVAANLSRYLELGASAADSEANLNLSGNIAHHVAVANQAGAFGTLIKGTSDLMIDGGHACKNDGVRGFGIHARTADNVFVRGFDASENHGQGLPWFNANPFASLDPLAIDVPDIQAKCFFGGLDPAATVNLRSTYENLLQGIDQFKQNGQSTDLCADITSEAAQRLSISYVLIWSTLAQFRRFSTGVGFGFWSCNFPTLEKCRALGNFADYDSGVGFAMYGAAEGALLSECVAADNRCNDVSQRGGAMFDIDGNVDITQWNLLYTFLKVGLLNAETVVAGTVNDLYGFGAIPNVINKVTDIDGPIPFQRKPTSLVQPEGSTTNFWTLSNRTMSVGFPTATIPTVVNERKNLYDFVSPVPLGAGILMECQRDGFVGESNAYGNKGNAGFGVGILSDAASSTMFIDNKATSNAADAMGYAWGLADMSISTPNIWYKNWMYANRVDEFMNSNYMISFDSVLSQSQTLPVKTIFPGSIDALTLALPLDNIVVSFVQDRQVSDCVADEVANKWKCLELAGPLGSTFSDNQPCGTTPNQQIANEVVRQNDFGGFVGKLAHHGTQTIRSGTSGMMEYHRNPYVGKPDLWTVANNTSYNIRDLSWTPDNQYCFAACATDGVVVFNKDLGIERIFIAADLLITSALSISVHPSGRYVAVGDSTGLIHIIDITHENPQHWVHFGAVAALNGPASGLASVDYLRFSPDGMHLAAIAGATKKYAIFLTADVNPGSWTNPTLATTPTTAPLGDLRDLAWRDNTYFAFVDKGDQRVYIVSTLAVEVALDYTSTTPAMDNLANCVAFNATGTKMFVGQQTTLAGTNIAVIDSSNSVINTTNWSIQKKILAGSTDIFNTEFNPNDDYAMVTQINGNLVIARLFDLTSTSTANWTEVAGSPITTKQSPSTGSNIPLAWDPNGGQVMIGSDATAVDGSDLSYLATVDTSSASVTDWIAVTSLNQNHLLANAPKAVGYDANSKRLVTANMFLDAGSLELWDVSGKQQILLKSIDLSGVKPTSLAFSADGAYLFVTTATTIQAYDPATLTAIGSPFTIQSSNDIKVVTINGVDYVALAVSLPEFVVLFEFNRATSTWTRLDGGAFASVAGALQSQANSVAVNSTFTRLVVGVNQLGATTTKNLKYFDISNPAAPILLATITDHGAFNVTSVALSPDGKTIASISPDTTNGKLMLHDVSVENAPVLIAFSRYQAESRVTFMPDGQHLVATSTSTATTDDYVRVFDTSAVHAGTLGSAYVVPGSSDTVNGVSVGADNDLYLAGSTAAKVINFTHPASSMNTYHSLAPHSYDIQYKVQDTNFNHSACAYSKDGRYLFAIDNTSPQSLIVYNNQGVVVKKFAIGDLEPENMTKVITSINCIAVHPHHDVLVVGTTNHGTTNIRYLDFSKTDKSAWTFTGVGAVTDPVTNFGFSPDGTNLIALSKSPSTDIQFVNVVNVYDPTSWTVTLGAAAVTDGKQVAWHPSGVYYAVANNTVGISIFTTTSFIDAGPLASATTAPVALSFNYDGSLLGVVSQTNVYAYNSSNPTPSIANWPQILTSFPASMNLVNAQFHPNKNVIIAVQDTVTSNQVQLFDMRNGDATRWTNTSVVPAQLSDKNAILSAALAINPQGTAAHIGHLDFDLSSTDVASWNEFIGGTSLAWKQGYPVLHMAVNPAGSMLVTTDSLLTSTVRTWKIDNKSYAPFQSHSPSAIKLNKVGWSTDGRLIFAAGIESGQLNVYAYDPNRLKDGPLTGLNNIAISNSTAVTCLAAVTVGGTDYLALGVAGGSTHIQFIKYVRNSNALTNLGDLGFTGTTQVNAVAWNATGTKLLTGGNDADGATATLGGEVGYFTFAASGPTLTQIWLNNTIHAGASVNISAVAISPDGTLLISADSFATGTGKIVAHNLTSGAALGAPLTRAVATKALAFSHDGKRLAASYDTATNNTVDVITGLSAIPALSVEHTYPVGSTTLNGASNSVAWGANDIDLFVGAGNVTKGVLSVVNDVHPLIVAIAQDMVTNSNSTTLASNIGHELARLGGFTTDAIVDSSISTVQSFITSSPTDLAGAIRALQATPLGQQLQGATTTPSSRVEMSKAAATRAHGYLNAHLKHPADAAVNSMAQQLELPQEQVRTKARQISAWVRDHLDTNICTPDLEVLRVDPFFKAIAGVVNNGLNETSVQRATVVVQAAYPEATYPGLARIIASAALEHLTNNANDLDGAAIAINRAFIKQGIPDATDKICKGLAGYVVAYINAVKNVLDAGGMTTAKVRKYDPLTTTAVVGVDHSESYRVTGAVYDAMRTTVVTDAPDYIPARTQLDGVVLSGTFNTEGALRTHIATMLSNTAGNPDRVDVTREVPSFYTKKMRYSIEHDTSTIRSASLGLTHNYLAEPDYPVTSTLASSLIGSGWARKALNDTFTATTPGTTEEVIDPTDAAKMTVRLMTGVDVDNTTVNPLLPDNTAAHKGYVYALRGDRVRIGSAPYTWKSATSSFTSTFTSLAEYLDFLHDDLLSGTFNDQSHYTAYTGLINSNATYAALSDEAKDVIARAIVLRTILSGDEAWARQVFSTASVVTNVAAVVQAILKGTTAAFGTAGLLDANTYATGASAAVPGFDPASAFPIDQQLRQAIAVMAILWIDQTGYTPAATIADKINALIKGAYLAATSVAGLPVNQQVNLATLGAVGTVAAFEETAALLTGDNASQVGTQIAKGLFDSANFIRALDFGATGLDGLAMDLSDQVLAAVASIIVLETRSSTEAFTYGTVSTANTAKNIGAYAAPLAYNQLYQDTLYSAIAKLSVTNDTDYGAALTQFVGAAGPSGAAEKIAAAALGYAELQRARNAVKIKAAELFTSGEPVIDPTTTSGSVDNAFVQHVVNVMQHPTGFTINPNGTLYPVLLSEPSMGITTAPFGHPADLASALGQVGSLRQSEADALADRLHTYLNKTDYTFVPAHQNDIDGAAQHACQR